MDNQTRQLGTLVLVRHGQSLWNAKHTWTGLTDIGLSEQGMTEAKQAATALKDIPFTVAFSSALCRAKDTLHIILTELGKTDIPVIESTELNERNYGIFTGKNKLEVEKEFGPEKYKQLRRGWDFPVENGESLKDVYTRVVPYYETTIVPLLQKGTTVLVVAHGNSLRALLKRVSSISDTDIAQVEFATGEIIIVTVDAKGNAVTQTKRTVPQYVT